MSSDGQDAIGVFTAVQGTVSVAHPGASTPIAAALQGEVRFRDAIETQNESRTKVLLFDDSLLTVGAHSRVEITEYIYEPERDTRSVVVKLVKGTVRALVSKVFSGSGSKFEVHTPTAVAAARGTNFVVWVEGDTSGVVNIGSHGRVDFMSGGETVGLDPHQFSVAGGGEFPTPAIMVTSRTAAMVSRAIEATDLSDAPEPTETSLAAILATGGAARAGPPGVISGATGNPETGR